MIDKNNYYLDVEELINQCRITKKNDPEDLDFLVNEDDNDEISAVDEPTLNIFKYETYKSLLTRFLDDYPDESEEENLLLNKQDKSYVVNIITNTFIKHNILKPFGDE